MLPSMLDEAIPALLRSAELLALLLLPVVGWAAARRLLRAADTVGWAAMPALGRFAFVSGALTGVLLALVSRDASYYAPHTILQAHGPWGVPFDELFTVWLDPRGYAPAALWARVRGLDPGDPVVAFAGLAAVLAAVVMAGALRGFHARAPRALLLSALVWLGAAALAVYVLCAGAWALHALNVWALVVLVLLARWYAWRRRVG